MQYLMRNFVYKLSGYLGEYMWTAPRQGGEWSAALGCSHQDRDQDSAWRRDHWCSQTVIVIVTWARKYSQGYEMHRVCFLMQVSLLDNTLRLVLSLTCLWGKIWFCRLCFHWEWRRKWALFSIFLISFSSNKSFIYSNWQVLHNVELISNCPCHSAPLPESPSSAGILTQLTDTGHLRPVAVIRGLWRVTRYSGKPGSEGTSLCVCIIMWMPMSKVINVNLTRASDCPLCWIFFTWSTSVHIWEVDS